MGLGARTASASALSSSSEGDKRCRFRNEWATLRSHEWATVEPPALARLRRMPILHSAKPGGHRHPPGPCCCVGGQAGRRLFEAHRGPHGQPRQATEPRKPTREPSQTLKAFGRLSPRGHLARQWPTTCILLDNSSRAQDKPSVRHISYAFSTFFREKHSFFKKFIINSLYISKNVESILIFFF